MQLHTVICEGGKLHRVDMSLFEKKAARTFGNDEGMALRERVDVQERKAGNSRPVSSTRSHLLRNSRKFRLEKLVTWDLPCAAVTTTVPQLS